MLSLSACNFSPTDPLTDAQVSSYAHACRNVRALVPSVGPPGSRVPELKDLNIEAIDRAVKDAGLANYAEFVLLSAKVGAAMSLIHAKELGSHVSKKVDAGRAQVEAALNDPRLPEDTKAELRAKLAHTQAEVETGSLWARRLLEFTDFLSSDTSQNVVRRHRKELQAAFR